MNNNPDTDNNIFSSTSHLMDELKRFDNRNLLELRRWQILIGVISLFYLLLLVVHPVRVLIIDVSCLLLFFIIYTVYYRKLSKKDYSIPVKELLIRTRKTYSITNPVTLLSALVAAPMMFASVDVLFTRYIHVSLYGCSSLCLKLVVFSIFYWVVLLIAYVVWHARYHAIIRLIDQNLAELDE